MSREEMGITSSTATRLLAFRVLPVDTRSTMASASPVRGASSMASLECVSLVTWFDQDTPLEAILASHPDILVKGGDWAPEKIVGAREVQAWGGSVHSIPFLHNRSTTALVQKIRSL